MQCLKLNAGVSTVLICAIFLRKLPTFSYPQNAYHLREQQSLFTSKTQMLSSYVIGLFTHYWYKLNKVIYWASFFTRAFFLMKIHMPIYILGKIWAPTSPVKNCNQGQISEIIWYQPFYATNFYVKKTCSDTWRIIIFQHLKWYIE